MTFLDRLRPPAEPSVPLAHPSPAQAVIEASIDADAAALGLIVALERRHAAVTAALAARVISAPLGKRMLARDSVERALAAVGLTRFAGRHRPASSRRLGFIGQARQALNKPEKGHDDENL